MSFDYFLDECRAPQPQDKDLTQAYLKAWANAQQSAKDSWWHALGAQVPPGILLLFLLDTLAALYR